MSTKNHWFEDDHFWEAVQRFVFSEQHWEVAPVQVEKILDLMKPPPGAQILDLCCGVGRHSVELARRGYRVTGVDLHSMPLPIYSHRSGISIILMTTAAYSIISIIL